MKTDISDGTQDKLDHLDRDFIGGSRVRQVELGQPRHCGFPDIFCSPSAERVLLVGIRLYFNDRVDSLDGSSKILLHMSKAKSR